MFLYRSVYNNSGYVANHLTNRDEWTFPNFYSKFVSFFFCFSLTDNQIWWSVCPPISDLCKLHVHCNINHTYSAVNNFGSRRPHFLSAEGASLLGGSGGMPPRKFWKLHAWKCYFQRFPDSTWALWTMKIKTVLTIFYVYYNCSFPQNINHWLLEKSEVINLQMPIHGEWKNVLSNVCLSFFGADAILGHAKACDLVLWNCHRRSMTLRSASTFLYFHGKVNTFKTPLMCLYVDSGIWSGCLTITFAESFHYF